MTYFLTSSPCVQGAARLNPVNGFVEELQKSISQPCAALFICSDPDSCQWTDRFAGDMLECFTAAGFAFTSFEILDRRTQERAAELIGKAELIILAGGHVPTQNRFFQEIGLRCLMQGYEGVVVGISAGTMNSADVVYAQPELEGEAADKDYVRFLPGLALTKTMVLPHYQEVKDRVLDGLRLFEDITCADSMGRRFYALVDGSYLFGTDGREELRGEAYLIENGSIRQISGENQILPLA